MSIAHSGPYSPSRWGYWSDGDDDLTSGEEAHECGPAFGEAPPEVGGMAPSGPLSLGCGQRHFLPPPSRHRGDSVEAVSASGADGLQLPLPTSMESPFPPAAETVSASGADGPRLTSPVYAGPEADGAPASLSSLSAGLGVQPEASAEVAPHPFHSLSPSRRERASDSKGEPPAPLGAIRPKALRDAATTGSARADPSPPHSLVAPRAGSLSLSTAWSPSRREGGAYIVKKRRGC